MKFTEKVNLKFSLFHIFLVFFLIVLLPLLCVHLFPVLQGQGEDYSYSGNIPEEVTLYRTKTQTYEQIPFETYIEGVVAAEMPCTFAPEALKAQAVASRTYALGRLKAGDTLCDSVHCQVYRDYDISPKVVQAVEETAGQVLLYHGELAAHALFFSSSAGRTENSEDVFSSPVPYLVSVKSSDEPGATHKNEAVTLSLSELSRRLSAAFPQKDFGSIHSSSVRVRKRTEGGRAAEVQIGRETLTGTEVRTALQLCSARMEISAGHGQVTFRTAGSGHGVGMSQYGANGMAKKGKSYRKILRHYYAGTTVSR